MAINLPFKVTTYAASTCLTLSIVFAIPTVIEARNSTALGYNQLLPCIVTDFTTSFDINHDSTAYYLQLSKTYADLGNKEMAYQNFQKYKQLKDSLFLVAKNAEISKLSKDVASLSKDKELADKQTQISKNKVLANKKSSLVAGLIIGIILLSILCLLSLKAFLGKRYLMKREQEQWKQDSELSMLNANFQGEHKEREKIAQQLQHSIAPLLHNVKSKLQYLETSHHGITQTAAFVETRKILADASDELHGISSTLATSGIHNTGLVMATKAFVQNISSSSTFGLSLQIRGDETTLSSEKQVAIYRILQELVQNIIKHSQASAALINLQFDLNKTTISIVDNGKGFNPALVTEGMGWKNIKDRLNYINGSYHITCEDGASISLTIPTHHVTGTV